MSNLDDEIAKALSAEDLTLSKQFEDLGLFGHFKTLFKGKDACCLLYTSPSPRDATLSRMPSSA